MTAFPASVSPAARAALEQYAGWPASELPAPDDTAAWEAMARQADAGQAELLRPSARQEPVTSTPLEVQGVRVFEQRPAELAHSGKALLYVHGGGLVTGGGEVAELRGISLAAGFAALTYTVDYRMPPAHPYPAGLDDCLAVYRGLLETRAASDIVVLGVSAGGNLAAALALRARDEGLPLPAGLVLPTPELDLTESGDSFLTMPAFDVVLKGSLMPANLLYAGGRDLADPYLSPLFGDLAGFPPCFLSAGTRDLFLSNAVRMHDRLVDAGAYSELHVVEGAPHGGFGGAPEDARLHAAQVAFVERAWAGALV
jgi:acetyl esterase/lipase